MSIFDTILSAVDDAFNAASDIATKGLERAKCLTGYHDWAAWTFVADKTCNQRRNCRRKQCTKTETRTHHDWTEFAYTSAKSCGQKSRCKRCGDTKRRTEHASWSDWRYRSEGVCDESRKCGRCAKEESRLEHSWGSWEFSGPRSCDKVRYCRRCSTGKETQEATWADHDLVRHRKINCDAMSLRCQRCGHASLIPEVGEFHEYGPWSRDPDRNVMSRQCVDCGRIERQ